jgi:hypothetical protein
LALAIFFVFYVKQRKWQLKSKPDGTLISIPVKPTFPFIAKFHPDTAALRRHMIECRILERDAESVYWVAEGYLG